MRATWRRVMKTKPLTFLLSLTFLFLFSGSVYGQEGVKKEYHDNGNLKSEGFKLFKKNHICFPQGKYDWYKFLDYELKKIDLKLCPDCMVLSHTEFKKEDLTIDKEEDVDQKHSVFFEYEGNGTGMLLTKTKKISLQYKKRNVSRWNYKHYFRASSNKWFVRNDTNEVLLLQGKNDTWINQRMPHDSLLFGKTKFDCYPDLKRLDKLTIDKWIEVEKNSLKKQGKQYVKS